MSQSAQAHEQGSSRLRVARALRQHGYADLGEACDTRQSSGSCDTDCTAPEYGDGFHSPAFLNPATGQLECGDAAGFSPVCNDNCTLAACGDLIHNPEFIVNPQAEASRQYREECDDGRDGNNNDECLDSCRVARCGGMGASGRVEASALRY